MTKPSRDEILNTIVAILADITEDWDMEYDDPIGENTKLMTDLEFESIDVVQFIVAIEERFKQRGIPFEKLLMESGRYVDEITVQNTIDFLDQHLA